MTKSVAFPSRLACRTGCFRLQPLVTSQSSTTVGVTPKINLDVQPPLRKIENDDNKTQQIVLSGILSSDCYYDFIIDWSASEARLSIRLLHRCNPCQYANILQSSLLCLRPSTQPSFHFSPSLLKYRYD